MEYVISRSFSQVSQILSFAAHVPLPAACSCHLPLCRSSLELDRGGAVLPPPQFTLPLLSSLSLSVLQFQHEQQLPELASRLRAVESGELVMGATLAGTGGGGTLLLSS
jgi:hypothetical protein